MAKMRVHELAKVMMLRRRSSVKSTKNPHQRQKKNLPQRKQKNQLHQRQRRKRDQRRRNQQMLSMTDQRKSPASQPCLTHSTANRAQDMEITEDRTREQKAADHRMADAR